MSTSYAKLETLHLVQPVASSPPVCQAKLWPWPLRPLEELDEPLRPPQRVPALPTLTPSYCFQAP